MRDISLCTGPSQKKNTEFNCYSSEERLSIAHAAALVRDLLRQLDKIIRPGVNELDIDIFCENYIILRNGIPFLKESGLYGCSVLISRNHKAYHGVPENYFLKEGDIVTVDVVLTKDGWFGDGAETFEVGKCSADVSRLVRFSKQIIFDAVNFLERERNLDLLGDFIGRLCRENGFRVLEEGAGHGIGKELHEAPLIQYVTTGVPFILRTGMVFTLEPVITNWNGDLYYDENETALVHPGFFASQFEYTIAVNDGGLEILT
ncbi:MAG: M24 family metallopeptidase [Spirochaetales bacterium]|nr:M24 family metallopeptidase [Spirochaetales bacterium]